MFFKNISLETGSACKRVKIPTLKEDFYSLWKSNFLCSKLFGANSEFSC